MAKVIRIDKNGTKYWVENKCDRCGGTGYIEYFNYVYGGVCFQCNGTGYHERKWKEYTPEYEAKLAERRLAKARKEAPEKNAKFFKRYGLSEDGTAWVVLGDTYPIKDELKAAGAKWNGLYGWHFDHEAENTIKVTIDKVAEMNDIGEWWFFDTIIVCDTIEKMVKAATPTKETEFVGQVGEKIKLNLTYKNLAWYETSYGCHEYTVWVYKFEDENGNLFVWKTQTHVDGLDKGEAYTVKGTVKEHATYKGEKQTVLTRCKVEA